MAGFETSLPRIQIGDRRRLEFTKVQILAKLRWTPVARNELLTLLANESSRYLNIL